MRPVYIDNKDTEDTNITEELRTELEATRATFHKLLLSIPEDDWHKFSSNPAWTIGELMYHMSMALRLLPEDVRLIRRLGWTTRIGTRC